MKTVKSESDLMRLAAKAGASVSLGGRVFNGQGAKVNLQRVEPKPEPKPEPEPEEKQESLALEGIAQAMQSQADAIRAQTQALLMMAPQPQQAPQMRPVRITVVRDSSDNIVSLVPIYGPGRASIPTGLEPEFNGRGLLMSVTPTYQ